MTERKKKPTKQATETRTAPLHPSGGARKADLARPVEQRKTGKRRGIEDRETR